MKLLISGVDDTGTQRVFRQLEQTINTLTSRITVLEGDVVSMLGGTGVVTSISGTSPIAAVTVAGAVTVSLLDNGVTDTKLRDSVGTSVVGRSVGSTGDPADIVASANGDVLRRSAGALGFGSIPESSVTSLVSDLAARPTGSGTLNKVTKWTAATVVGDSSITDTGALVTVANPLTVTGAGTFQSTLDVTGNFAVATSKFTVAAATGNTLVAGTLDVTGNFAVNTNKFTVAASSGNTVIAGTLSLTPMTQGSVLYIGASGLVSQDNSNLYYDATNKRFGVGSGIGGAPTNPITTKGAGTSDMISMQNTTVTQWATIVARDDGGTVRTAWGYGNASSTDTPRAGRAHWWAESGTDFVVMRGGAIPGTALMFITNSNGNVNIGPTVSDPGFRLRVEGSTASTSFTVGTGAQCVITNSTGANSGSLNVKNLDTAGASSVTFVDASGPGRGGVGYGGSGMTSPVAHIATKNFLLSTNNSSDWVFANLTRNEVTVGMTTGSTYIEQQNGSSAAVSSSNTGRLRYNTTGQKYQVSVNTGAYTDVVISASAAVGTTNALTKWSAANTITNTNVTDNGTTVAVASLFTVTSTSGTSSANTTTWTPVAGTTGTLSAGVFTSNGTFNTTSGALSEFALRAVSSAARSSGANSLTGVAGYFDSTGAQVNVALQTASGDNYLNATAGSTGVGYALGASLPQKLSVTGSIYATTNLQIDGSATIGDAVSDGPHTINGNVVLNDDGISSGSLRIVNTPVLATAAPGIVVAQAGTFDTTAAGRFSQGIQSIVSSTIGAGANSLTTRAVYASSTGGTINYAFFSDLGDNRFNASGGSTTFSRDVSINGNATIGDASGDSHTVNGTFTCNHALNVTGAVVLSSTLSVNGAATIGDATGDTHTLNGSIIQVAAGGGVTPFQQQVSTSAWGMRIAGGSNELFQLGTTSGTISTYYFGPSAISGTGELVVTNTDVVANVQMRIGSSTAPILKSGSGSPETVVTAPVGSLYLRIDGGAGTSIYVKESGTGNTGWAAK